MINDNLLTVGELAETMDVTVRTLQYYDKQGLLKPSKKSEGGRRLYSKRDMVKLHQILSLKFLGFSLEEIKNNLIPLDTPDEVLKVLSKQRDIVQSQINNLKTALSAIEALQDEVSQMQKVDFNKYADIISLLRLKNEGYWVVKFFDDKLMDHIKNRFSDNPDAATALFNQWESMCDEIFEIKANGIKPESDIGQKIAAKWWQLVIDFTGGDFSLLPELMKFHDTQQDWSEDLKAKQQTADTFINEALAIYFKNNNITLFEGM